MTTAAFTNYYELLEVPPTATSEQITEALRQERRKWITRQNAPKQELRQQAESRVRQLDEAEQILLDPARRATFDEQLRTYVPPRQPGSPTSGRDWLGEARQFLAHGDVQSASYAAREATQADGGNPEAWAVRGEVSARLGNVQDAIFEYRQAISMDPKQARFHFALGMVYERIKSNADGMLAYSQAARLDPSVTAYRAAWGNILAVGGAPEAALPLLEQVVQEEPDNVHHQRLLAVALSKAGLNQWTELPNGLNVPMSEDQARNSLEMWSRAASLNFEDPHLRQELAERISKAQDALAVKWAYRPKTYFWCLVALAVISASVGASASAAGYLVFIVGVGALFVLGRKPGYVLSKRLAQRVHGV